MGFGDIVSDMTRGIRQRDDSRKNAADAQRAKDRLLRTIDTQDWDADYSTEFVKSGQTGGADFGRTQSPQARAYLESFLSGSNPNTMSSVTDPTGQNKKAAQIQFDKNYGDPWNNQGGWEQLHEQERELDKKPIFSVGTPEKQFAEDPANEAANRDRWGKSHTERALDRFYNDAGNFKKNIEKQFPRGTIEQLAKEWGVDTSNDVEFAEFIDNFRVVPGKSTERANKRFVERYGSEKPGKKAK